MKQDLNPVFLIDKCIASLEESILCFAFDANSDYLQFGVRESIKTRLIRIPGNISTLNETYPVASVMQMWGRILRRNRRVLSFFERARLPRASDSELAKKCRSHLTVFIFIYITDTIDYHDHVTQPRRSEIATLMNVTIEEMIRPTNFTNLRSSLLLHDVLCRSVLCWSIFDSSLIQTLQRKIKLKWFSPLLRREIAAAENSDIY